MDLSDPEHYTDRYIHSRKIFVYLDKSSDDQHRNRNSGYQKGQSLLSQIFAVLWFFGQTHHGSEDFDRLFNITLLWQYIQTSGADQVSNIVNTNEYENCSSYIMDVYRHHEVTGPSKARYFVYVIALIDRHLSEPGKNENKNR